MASRRKTPARKSTSKKSSRSEASKKVGRAMHQAKRGQLRAGRSGKKVTSRKQAIAIGLSEARRAGASIPRPRKTASKKRPAERMRKKDA